MKKSLIVGAALVACTVVLTLMSGLAQAQSLSSPTMRVEEDKGETEKLTKDGITTQFVDPNRFFTGVCRVGPRSGDVTFRCFNIGFTSNNPRLVLCQTRNSSADPTSYPDQFACQIIETGAADNGFVRFRIRRLDANVAWGQDLFVNLLVVN
jgi:hypothetical protein